MIRSITLFLLMALALQANPAQLERFINDEVASRTPPSVAIAVVKDNILLYEKAFGYNDFNKTHASSVDSVYHAFSLTKILTAIAVMQLVEQNRLSLDDEVTRHLPWFVPRYNDQNVTVTLEQLLNHSSGIRNDPEIARWLHSDDDKALTQSELAVEKGFSYIELAYAPGSTAKYANMDYILLGAIIEKATGKRYEAYVSERILAPLHMIQSGFRYGESFKLDEVFGTMGLFSLSDLLFRAIADTDAIYAHSEGTTMWLKRFYTGQTPPSGLLTSAHDMGLFLLGYLKGVVLKPKTLEMLHSRGRIEVSKTFSSFDRTEHGLGWYHLEDEDKYFLQHQGVGPGFRNIMRIYPKENIAFVILTNRTGTDIDDWADRVFEAFRDKP